MPGKTVSILVARIRNRSFRLGVIGLGYVGLPLAVEFAKQGFRVTGIDTDVRRVRQLNAGRSYITDVPTAELAPLVRSKRLSGSNRYAVLRELDGVMICVPTPLRKSRDPDMSFILGAAEALAKHLHRGQVIILESTTYPGTTEEVILPMLEATGLKVGRDFHLGFSPERIDPGNADYTAATIPKVVSGVTPACCRVIQALYGQVMREVHPVSSTRVGEMVKLLENTFRSVNIGLVNELALMCHRLGVDVWEVIEAAKTKPFGFMPFYPGPGLGGHCIPVDPLYLSWKAKLHGFETRFIELASQVNAGMPHHIVDRIAQALNDRRKALKGAKILVLGVAYKPNVGDMRESPALEVIQDLLENGAEVRYHDPHVPAFRLGEKKLNSIPLTPARLKGADCAVILTHHDALDYRGILRHAAMILDTRNALRRLKTASKKVIWL
ncbi:MAG: UDP-N-acetyl-D-glucosamine dehydrogenase [Candidatus Omnitrophica bacterium CG11_big_fil_rev_8_21_14_0_20_64_10]|nr:MAG: UDP-N-acetyl-D-glucosamine dehydrogenase [Candidatus Omnitrophica bacterium CG11_big_fil_rev_8_21_14_0_20_64_10]